VLSVLGIALVLRLQVLPTIASREATIENDAFVLLLALSVPVLMLGPMTRSTVRRSMPTSASRASGWG